MKFAICNEIFLGWPLDKACAFAREVGYGALEIAPFTLDRPIASITSLERSEIRRTVENSGLEVCGLHWVLAHTEGLHLTHPSSEVRARTAEYLRVIMELCRDLGGRIIVFGSPKQRSLLDGVSMEMAWRFAQETFRPALELAERAQITLCFEPLSPVETNFINTAEEACRFALEAGSPAMKVILDVKAMASERLSIPENILAAQGKFAHFHANDPNLKGPGFGQTDFVPIFAALKKSEYHGYVSVEVFDFTEGPEVIARRSLEYMRTCLHPA